MDRARVRKDPHEIELIRKANAVTAAAHRDVLRKVSKFRNETEIQATFLDACVARDAKHQAYGIIAASGASNSILHYVDNDQTLVGKQLVLLDAGCEWDCYASDVTRTFPISGSWPSTEAKAIYDLVDLIQSNCIERLKPGVRYLDLHYHAQMMAIRGLLQLGIFHKGTAEEIFEARTVMAFFPHGLGHHLGLEVHDVSNVSLMASNQHDEVMRVFGMPNTRPYMAPCTVDSPLLEEGMVVTVEPGIYFNSYALNYIYMPSPVQSKYINLDVLKRYMPVGGVRIEDDILITHDGYKNLTTAPKGDEMLCLIGGKDSEVRGNVATKNNENRASMVINNEKISYCFELDDSTNSFKRVKKISQKENLRRATELLKALDFNPELISPAELDIPKISAHIHRALLNQSKKSKSPLLRDQVRTQQLLTLLTIEPFTFDPGELDYHDLVDKLLWQISCHVRDSGRTEQKRGISQDGSESFTGESSGSSNRTEGEEEGGMSLHEQNSNTQVVELVHQHPAPNPSSSNPKLKEYQRLLRELELQNQHRAQIAKAEQREQEALNNINTRLLQLSASSTTISNELATISTPPLHNPISDATTVFVQHATNTDTERYKQQLRMLERINTVHYKRALNEVKRVGGVEPGGVKPVEPVKLGG